MNRKNYSLSTNDREYYNYAYDYIDSNELDKAWQCIKQIKSEPLKNSFFPHINDEITKLRNKIKFTGYYEGCDGNVHSYDDSSDGGYSGGGGDGGPCLWIFGTLVFSVCTIVCSMQMGNCCWCELCDTIGEIIDWCS